MCNAISDRQCVAKAHQTDQEKNSPTLAKPETNFSPQRRRTPKGFPEGFLAFFFAPFAPLWWKFLSKEKNPVSWKTHLWLTLAGLSLALTLGLTVQVVRAACGFGNLSNLCSASYGLVSSPSTVHVPLSNTPPSAAVVDQAVLQSSGPLLYPDYKVLEAEARELLRRSMNFRQDISPYRASKNFNDLVRHFDENSGFSASYTDPILGVLTLQQRIDTAVTDLLRAREIYGFLAVYAPAARMKADPDYAAALCQNAENPNPRDPQHAGQVLDPILDWCNFPARLRQAVREAAYLRMIFAQQFMVDALGLHFSAGALLGGENFVKQEVAKLDAAKYQYELAQQGLSQAIGYRLGNGCYLSDFYTQSEWALLSRANDGKLTAQHHMATRLSYLDINTNTDVERAQNAALTVYRGGSAEGYVKMIGLAGFATSAPSGSHCQASGARPDGSLVGEMALTMLDTREAARQMMANRNVFGFDIRFTPARPYHTAFGSTDKGLWEQAKEAADAALQIQLQTENAERTFDLNQQDLTKAILATNNKVDNEIQIEAGCDLQGFATDAEWYACIDDMITHTQECDPTSNTFDACMNRTTDGQPPKPDGTNWLILVSDMRTARQDLRVAWLAVEAAVKKRDNIVKRADTETLRNIRVRSTILKGAEDNSVLEAIIVAANCCTLGISFPPEFTVNPGAFVEAGLRSKQLLDQAAREVQIEDANSEAVVRNLFYDMAEAQGEIDIAVQQFQSMLTQFNGVIGQTGHDVYQSKREHAYTTALPANDPSYRMVRDSRRLELAAQLETAARLAYLAARRAEYEYTARLSANNFRISDIYKARTANDILKFLQDLDVAVSNLPGGVKDAETNELDLTISVAQHVLGLTDKFLRGQGIAEANLPAERTARFRQWVAQNTVRGADGKVVLIFNFTASSATNGLIGQVVTQGYDFFWLHKVAGNGQPKPNSRGVGLNLVTAQGGNLGYRQVRISQSGQVGLTSFAGCLFDYRLIPPAALLGLEFPAGQPTDLVTGLFNGDINGAKGNGASGFSTPAFLGRPLASNGWQVVINAGSPNGILPDMDLQQLTDIELKISTTYASRSANTPPTAAQCVRADF
ncbi:MAG: hypothetical protein DYG89_43505 [Caldilinea sp. CFX5]|nr:hypothetical protein [Caldilinea sp. CFX5]